MLCSICPINDLSGYLRTTFYLALMLQASRHYAEGNEESEGSYIIAGICASQKPCKIVRKT